MTRHARQLAAAALAVGIAAAAPAGAIATVPGLARAIAPAAGSQQHPIVWQCVWKPVCLKWGNHHNCERWGQKKVCNPATTTGSKAPPYTPPKIKKRL
jgi:hypothetical protein